MGSSEKQYNLTHNEAAKAIGCGISTLSKWIADGKVPSLKDGHNRLFSESDCAAIKAAIEEHGRAWHEHVTFDGEVSESSDEEVAAAAEGDDRNLATKLKDMANKLRAGGHHEEASELYSTLVNSVDWSELTL